MKTYKRKAPTVLRTVGEKRKGSYMSKEIRVFMEPDVTSERRVTPGRWMELPIEKKFLEYALTCWTGRSWGVEYIISDYENPYYPIHPQDDIWIDNKAAELIEYLDTQGKTHLKKWCEKYETEFPDATEVANAVIQIYAIMKNTKDLSFEEIDSIVFPEKYKKSEILEMRTELLLKKELGTLSKEETEEYEKVLDQIKETFKLGFRVKRTYRGYERQKKTREKLSRQSK